MCYSGRIWLEAIMLIKWCDVSMKMAFILHLNEEIHKTVHKRDLSKYFDRFLNNWCMPIVGKLETSIN